MEKFLETHKLWKLNQEETEYLNKPKKVEIESVIKKHPTKRAQDQTLMLNSAKHLI